MQFLLSSHCLIIMSRLRSEKSTENFPAFPRPPLPYFVLHSITSTSRVLAAPHERRVGQLRGVLQRGRNHSKTRLESGTHFRRFHGGAPPSSEGVQTPSRSRRQVPAWGRCAKDSVVPVQAKQRRQAQDLPAWEPQGAGPPLILSTQGFAARSRAVRHIEVAPALSHSVGFKSDAQVPEPLSLAAHAALAAISRQMLAQVRAGGCLSAGRVEMRITPLGPRGPAPCLWCWPPALPSGG